MTQPIIDKELVVIEIKKIKLSPKKGGTGFVSSYSVNIGSSEAKGCGLVDENKKKIIVKVIDPANSQIIIKEKQFTLTDEILQTVTYYATKSNELNSKMMQNIPGVHIGDGYGVVDMCDIPIPGLDNDNVYANELHKLEREFYQYLLDLPYEALTDIMTLMYMGRNQDADMTLPSTQRFVDYWAYLEMNGCFSDGPEAIADKVMEKTPLAQYLQIGRRIFLEEPQTESPEKSMDYEESNWNIDYQ